MDIGGYFPVWDKLSAGERERLINSAVLHGAPAGRMLHYGAEDCQGIFLVRRGQLRAFILSDEGREITLYRLFERDICLFSASCIIRSVQFEIHIEAEKASEMWVIPPDVYRELMDESAALANYTNEIMASRFSEVMWLMEQIMWQSFDKRLAAFLVEESGINNSDTVALTHERIAAHMGTAREVVTRMLNYFQDEGVVALERGSVRILDKVRLASMAE